MNSKQLDWHRHKNMQDKQLMRVSVWQDTYLSAWPAFNVFSALIRVRAAAASSRAQLTEEVRRRSTSGSAKALPSAVESLPMPVAFDAKARQMIHGRTQVSKGAPKKEDKKQRKCICEYILFSWGLRGEKQPHKIKMSSIHICASQNSKFLNS